jgi:hypothetical protein
MKTHWKYTKITEQAICLFVSIMLMILLIICELRPAHADSIPLTKDSGVYYVPVKINDEITLNFVLDSGAGDVQIPEDVALTLVRTGTITMDDILDSKNYTQADGTQTENKIINIKELTVGGYTIYNVHANVGKSSSVLLLGQGFLEHFSTWGINNEKQELALGDVIETGTKTSSNTLEAVNTDNVDMFIIQPADDGNCRKLPSHSIKEEILLARKEFGRDLHIIADTFYNEKFNSWMAFINVGESGNGGSSIIIKGDFEQCKKFAVAIMADSFRAHLAKGQ